jgi:hypothetical protein
MKKINFLSLLVTALIVVISSCSKDQFEITNTWVHDSTKETAYVGPNYGSSTFAGDGEVTFYSDGTGESTSHEFYNGSFSWTLNDDKLLITSGNFAKLYTLLTMEAKEMVAFYDERQGDEDGSTFELRFSRK